MVTFHVMLSLMLSPNESLDLLNCQTSHNLRENPVLRHERESSHGGV